MAITVKNAAGADVSIETPVAVGRVAAAAAKPIVLSTEDKAALDLVATAALQGSLTETAPATDTASSGLNGRLQRVSQRLTSLIALIPTALGAGGGLKVDGSGTALPVSASALPLPTGASTETTLAAQSAKLPATLGQKAMAASMAVTIASDQSAITVSSSAAASELHLGEVGGNTAVVAMTFVLDTSIYASGDVLAATAVLTSALRKNDGTGILQSITLNDKDDQGIALYVVILDANNSIGAANAVVSISDANADSVLAIIPVEAADWIDLGGCRVAHIRNLGIPIKATSGAATIYVALITRGTPTHSVSGITGRFGILRD